MYKMKRARNTEFILQRWKSRIPSNIEERINDYRQGLNLNTLGERIYFYRKKLNISQDDLGLMIGGNCTAISHYENNDFLPTKKWLERFIQTLNDHGIDVSIKEITDVDNPGIRNRYILRR